MEARFDPCSVRGGAEERGESPELALILESWGMAGSPLALGGREMLQTPN